VAPSCPLGRANDFYTLVVGRARHLRRWSAECPREQQEHTHRFVDDKRTAAELCAELQAEAAERGIRLIPSDDGTFEPVEGAKCNGKTED
jgi:hypothetical protein